ncbi:forespore capture DNA-binding protein RefZ [Bacillus salacetis]|uniref:forespore capture DNA-binding protein RefZ n=1 Tax=Bacillus salacetis TaxID=2315464 RepID=UPI003BA16139
MAKSAAQGLTKENILLSAVSLFNTKGYNGTSVRDIAKKASVNAANISYHFHGKQGLLESCFTRFFESYLECLETEADKLDFTPADECLKRAVYNILQYQSENHLLSRFVWREVSIDSQIVREIISSYLMKERYLLKRFFEVGKEQNRFTSMPVSIFIIQLKSMLSMPFLNSQYLREVWHVFPQEQYFVDRYFTSLEQWIDQCLLNGSLNRLSNSF